MLFYTEANPSCIFKHSEMNKLTQQSPVRSFKHDIELKFTTQFCNSQANNFKVLLHFTFTVTPHKHILK